MALTQVSTGGIKDGQVQTADLADGQVTVGKLHADALDHTYTLGADGSNHYTFTGEGLTGAVNDPTLYLTRGKTYRFVNGNSAGAHPFRIQTTVNGSAGTEYNTGVTNNGGAGGSTIIFEVPHAAPDVLYYQCTSHGAMGGILYVTGALADGTVTTAKLADQAVTLAKLPHGTSSNDGKFLRANNGADPTFETVNTDLVSDTSPQLGGNLDTNDKNIILGDSDGGSGNDNRVIFGAGTDLQIYHDGCHSYLDNTGTANLYIKDAGIVKVRTGTFGVDNADGSEAMISATANGAVELYHDNAKKLETYAGGIRLNGVENAGSQLQIGASNDFAIEHDGSNTYLGNNTGDLVLQNDAAVKITAKAGGIPRFRFDSDGLKFGSDTAAANALYDYEEGNFDPIMYEGQGSQQINYTWRYGNYVKIGSVVHIMLSFGIASFNTSGWNRSTITVPFNTAQNHAPFDNDNFSYIDLHGYSYLSGYGDGGGQNGGDNGGLYLQISQSHGNRMEIVYGQDKNYAGVNQLAAGQRVAIQFSYYTS